MQVKDVPGEELHDESGKRLGEIEKVARTNTTGQAAAVIGVAGGVLDIGGRDIAIPLSGITLQNGKLTAPAVPDP